MKIAQKEKELFLQREKEEKERKERERRERLEKMKAENQEGSMCNTSNLAPANTKSFLCSGHTCVSTCTLIRLSTAALVQLSNVYQWVGDQWSLKLEHIANLDNYPRPGL